MKKAFDLCASDDRLPLINDIIYKISTYACWSVFLTLKSTNHYNCKRMLRSLNISLEYQSIEENIKQLKYIKCMSKGFPLIYKCIESYTHNIGKLYMSLFPSQLKNAIINVSELCIDKMSLNLKVLNLTTDKLIDKDLMKLKHLETLIVCYPSYDNTNIIKLSNLPKSLKCLSIVNGIIITDEKCQKLNSLHLTMCAFNNCDLNMMPDLRILRILESLNSNSIIFPNKENNSLIHSVTLQYDTYNLEKKELENNIFKYMDNLHKLTLEHVSIPEDFENLRNLECLSLLDCDSRQVFRLNNMCNLQKLKCHNLQTNNVKFSDDNILYHLDVIGDNIGNNYIKSLDNLIYLNAQQTNIDNFNNLTHLHVLYVDNQCVTNDSIKNLKNLTNLSCESTSITNINHLSNLTRINISNTNINIDGINKLYKLRNIITNKKISDFTMFPLLRNIHACISVVNNHMICLLNNYYDKDDSEYNIITDEIKKEIPTAIRLHRFAAHEMRSSVFLCNCVVIDEIC